MYIYVWYQFSLNICRAEIITSSCQLLNSISKTWSLVCTMATMCPNGRGRILGKVKPSCSRGFERPPVVQPTVITDPDNRLQDSAAGESTPHQRGSADHECSAIKDQSHTNSCMSGAGSKKKQNPSKHSVHAGKVSLNPKQTACHTGNLHKSYRARRFPLAETRFIEIGKK